MSDIDKNPIGMIFIKDEPFIDQCSKFMIWLGVLIIFVLLIIHVSKYFENKECDFYLRDENKLLLRINKKTDPFIL